MKKILFLLSVLLYSSLSLAGNNNIIKGSIHFESGVPFQTGLPILVLIPVDTDIQSDPKEMWTASGSEGKYVFKAVSNGDYIVGFYMVTDWIELGKVSIRGWLSKSYDLGDYILPMRYSNFKGSLGT